MRKMSERTSTGWSPYVSGDARQTDADLHRAIDRVFDKAETFVSGLGRAFGVDTSGRPAPVPGSGPGSVPALNPPSVRALPASSQPTITERPFEIVEVMSGGAAIAWLVTNGCESARCESRAIAEAVLDHLQKATSK